MSLYFIGEEQTLQDILTSREERVEHQQYLLNKFSNTIVSYKLNIPGAIKYNSLIKQIFDEGLRLFLSKLEQNMIEILHEQVIYKNSGPEYFAVIDASSYKIKQITTKIEENHTLGRIYDYDVLNSEGRHIDRQELGIEARKCLLCDRNAFQCGRSRNHEVSKLMDKIENMALNYFKKI
jgi:holo-ACP synthase